MSTLIKIISFQIVLCFLFPPVASADQKLRELLTSGKWVGEISRDCSEQYTYNSDGTYSVESSSGEVQTGTYQFDESQSLIIWNIKYDNKKPDCSGDLGDETGEVRKKFLEFAKILTTIVYRRSGDSIRYWHREAVEQDRIEKDINEENDKYANQTDEQKASNDERIKQARAEKRRALESQLSLDDRAKVQEYTQLLVDGIKGKSYEEQVKYLKDRKGYLSRSRGVIRKPLFAGLNYAIEDIWGNLNKRH